ncbi:putative oxidoreductase [Streptosporangium becharense]|uniref:Putative oxidoreductase n=1 Tax=Streptosporangium becharense TaxID=1816182 RepID=A0A7W9IK30_9ACTN|nr:DoxX family protein [Streptosporangium becharense]MBB2913197.1 putative oxidoreductase [Streptosporangium becharense]MBB5822180.1 putative oxidoreductase [Streptosporangium becharense]
MRRTLHDLASLAARLGVGGIFFANGWHKLEAGLTATAGQFATLEAPAPGVWAAVTMLTELLGGVLMVAGLAVAVCGLLLFAEALAVFVVASGGTGLPLTGGDVKLIVALGAASVLLAVGGAGRLSVDHLVVIKRREAEAAEDFAAETEADDVIASLREPETSAASTSASTGRRPYGADGPARPGPAPSPVSPPAAGRAETPRSPSTGEDPGARGNPESTVDTAEFPAVPRTGTPPRRDPAPAPGTTDDILVAGKKDGSPEG